MVFTIQSQYIDSVGKLRIIYGFHNKYKHLILPGVGSFGARINALKKIHTLLLILDSGIDFGAMDGKKVDIIFVLLVPNVSSTTHVKVLAEIASVLDNKAITKKIRLAKKPSEIMSLMSNV